MRHLKLLILIAAAATISMALAGASSASASELCTEFANPCPSTKKITKIEASLIGGTAKLEDTEKNVLDTCTGGAVKITNITGGAGVNPTGSVPKEDLTWTGCTFTTDTVENGIVEIPQASGGGSTIIAQGSEVAIHTVLFGTCVYSAGTGLDLGNIVNGGNELVINKTVKKTANAVCPETAVWNATYKVTNHTRVFYIHN